MDIKNFLNKVCKEVKYEPARKGIKEELRLHMQEIKEDYINSGTQECEAEEKTVSRMGVAEEIGKKLNKIHKPKLDWKLLILILILMGFGMISSILKQQTMHNGYIGNTINYMLIGVILSIVVYFFDYRKMKNYSNIIYLLASAIMFLPIIGLSAKIDGINYASIFNITFLPSTVAIPFYIIAFIGYIINYNKHNEIKISLLKKKIAIKKDLLKIVILSMFSLVLIIMLPSLVNAIILAILYSVIATMKIIRDNIKYVKKLVILYGTVTIFLTFLIFGIVGNQYKIIKINTLSNSESEHIEMVQKEIIENAKFIGETETQMSSSEELLVSEESNFTFLYLLGKIGLLFSGLLVIVIILTSIKLILNAKNIKDQYGKFIIVGLSILYILQSIGNVFVNVNLGIKADINLPFVTYGAVYFIVSIINIAIILSVYKRKDINLYDEMYGKHI